MSPSLSNLHSFYQPASPPWTPQTMGWYILFALLAALTLWSLFHFTRKWIKNRYRRMALRELPLLEPYQFSTLLKRTALAAWPRDTVASLTGSAWLAFLNASSKSKLFQQSPGNRIEEIALQPQTLSAAEEQQLRQLAAQWIRRHHVQA